MSNVDALPHDKGDGVDQPARRPALQPGAVAPGAAHAGARRASPTFVELGPGAVLTGMAKRSVDGARTLSVATPDDLDRLLEFLADTGIAAAAGPEGEHLFATERLVVSPAAGVFRPVDGLGRRRPDLHRARARPRRRPTRSARRSRASCRPTSPSTASGSPAASPSPGCGRPDVPRVPQGARGVAITGWGTALPDKVVTNDDLAATIDTSDEWITERTGIRERRVGGTTSGLAIEAGRAALARAGVEPAEIDLVILATTTPDQTVPGHLGHACSRTSASGAAPSTSTPPARASSTAWPLANGILGAGVRARCCSSAPRRCRASSTGTTAAPPSSSPTVPAPWCSRPSTGPGQLLGWDLDADGAAQPFLYADVGDYLKMDGREVFRRAVRLMVDSAPTALDARRRHAPTTSRWSCPTRPTSASSTRPASASASPLERTAINIDRYRQHLRGLDPAGAGRGPRRGPRRRRRPRAARRLRRRHDRGQRGPPLEQPVIVRMSRVVLVTGGARGIGLACARRFVELRRQGRRHLPRHAAARRACFAVPVRRHRRRPRSTPPSPRSSSSRPGRGAGVQRRHHPRRPGPAHERGRLHRRSSTPTSPAPTGSPSGPPRA